VPISRTVFTFAVVCFGALAWGGASYQMATYEDPGVGGAILGFLLIAGWLVGVEGPISALFALGVSLYSSIYMVVTLWGELSLLSGVGMFLFAFALTFVTCAWEPNSSSRRR
jgi:hypothetical protein